MGNRQVGVLELDDCGMEIMAFGQFDQFYGCEECGGEESCGKFGGFGVGGFLEFDERVDVKDGGEEIMIYTGIYM